MAIQINELIIRADISRTRKEPVRQDDKSVSDEDVREKRMRSNVVFKQFRRKDR